jgi:hypothetical protein
MADMPAGVLAMAMHANDNIKATTGLFDSSLGARGSATSGVQERAQQQQGDLANFHFADNLRLSVKHCGRCIASMLPHYYDGTRVLALMNPDETMRAVTVNQPGNDKSVDLTRLQSEVTVSTGPSYSTMRQEAADGMLQLASKVPQVMQAAGDLLVKNLDWPGATEIAERLGRMIPPNIKGDDAGNAEVIQTPKGPLPLKDAPQAIAALMQTIDQLTDQLQKAGVTKAEISASATLEKAQMDNARALEVARIQAEGAANVAELRGLIDLLLQKLQPPPVLAGEVATDLAGGDDPA